MMRALITVLIFDFVTAVPRIALPMLMPDRPPEIVDPRAPTNNRAARRRQAKFARAA